MLVELVDRVSASADALDTLYLPGKLYDAGGGFLEGTRGGVRCAGEAMRGEGPVLIESSPTLG